MVKGDSMSDFITWLFRCIVNIAKLQLHNELASTHILGHNLN